MFALLGGNGVGESTTLLTCGLLQPDAGTVEVLGASPSVDGERVRASVAYLPEQAQLYPELDAYENLGYFLELAGVDFSHGDLDEALTTVRCARMRARSGSLETYSKGMPSRIGRDRAGRLLRRIRCCCSTSRPPIRSPWTSSTRSSIASVTPVSRC